LRAAHTGKRPRSYRSSCCWGDASTGICEKYHEPMAPAIVVSAMPEIKADTHSSPKKW